MLPHKYFWNMYRSLRHIIPWEKKFGGVINMKHGIADCVSFWESLGEKHRTLLESNTIFRTYRQG